MGPLLFIVFFNDITDARIVKFADDTVIYVADKDMTVIWTNKMSLFLVAILVLNFIIWTKLSKNMGIIADWFDENGLVINLKKGQGRSSSFRDVAKDCKTE